MKYELTTLYNINDNITEVMEKIENIIKDFGVTIEKVVNEGEKRLAYTIAGQDMAVYVFYILDIKDNETASKLCQKFNITDEIIRYLLVRSAKQ